MISKTLHGFLSRMRKRLREITPRDVAAAAGKELFGRVPVIRHIVDDMWDKTSDDEQLRLIQDLTKLSQTQFEELSRAMDLSLAELITIRERLMSEGFLPSIERVLKKSVDCEPQVLRSHPLWVDFEQRYVLERKEVDQIIASLQEDKIHLVVGKPAAGKSVVLKNVGFKLANQSNTVHFIDVKSCPEELLGDYFFKRVWTTIADEKVVIIVDDAHRQLSMCRGLVLEHQQRASKSGLIIGIRDVKGLEGTDRDPSPFKDLRRTVVCAADVADQVIDLFLEKKHAVMGASAETALKADVKVYEDDLWNVAFALTSCDMKSGAVSEYDIHKAIYNHITAIDAGDIFLPVAAFYRFELPVEKRLLTKELQLNQSSIDELVALGELTQFRDKRRGELLSISHSSVASKYFETYRDPSFSGLGIDVKEQIRRRSNQDDWERGLVYVALESSPINVFLDLIEVSDFDPFFDTLEFVEDVAAGFIELLTKFLKDDRLLGSVERAIGIEEDLDRLSKFIRTIAGLNKEAAVRLYNSALVRLERETLQSCVGFVWGLIENWEFPECLAPSIETLLSKMQKTEDLQDIGGLVKDIVAPEWDTEDVALPVREELIDEFVRGLVPKVDGEEDIGEIAELLECVNRHIDGDITEGDVSTQILARMDIDKLVKKMIREPDIEKVISCSESIASIHPEVLRTIGHRLPRKARERLQKWYDLR